MFRLNIPVCRHPISTVSYYASPCASLGRRIPVLSRFGLSSRSNDLPNVLFELDFIVRAKSRTDTLLEQVFFSISLRSTRRIMFERSRELMFTSRLSRLGGIARRIKNI